MKYKPSGESVKKYLLTCVTASALAVGAGAASAATFVIDRDASSVTLSQNGSICVLSSCGLMASLADDLGASVLNLSNPNDVANFDFLTFTSFGYGASDYSIEATLAFSSPVVKVTGQSIGVLGRAFIPFVGNITGGVLTWTAGVPTSIDFGNGGKATVDFAGGLAVFLGSEVTTQASVKLDVAEIPLPAAGWLLLAGIGGLAAMRRRKTSEI